jgi:hypothetical protein
MRRNLIPIIVIIIIAAAGWGIYVFLKDRQQASSAGAIVSVQSLSPGSCWIYHEYVYRVDFKDTNQRSFFFIRNADGSFSPSNAENGGNNITGNGFIIDSAGACVVSQKMAAPWELSDEEKAPLNDMLQSWLDLKDGLTNSDYFISGQTVALFVVLNDPKDFIDYKISAVVPGQDGYRVIYPSNKLLIQGLQTIENFSGDLPGGPSGFQVLKTTFDTSNKEYPVAITTVDSISAEINNDHYLTNITVMKGDPFFYEGSMLFGGNGMCIGHLHFENEKWKLIPLSFFVQQPPAYPVTDAQQTWAYDVNGKAWKKL